MYKTLLIPIFFSLLSTIGCLPSGDPFKFSNDFNRRPPAEAVDKCLLENKNATTADCDLSACLSSPITLLALHELLLETVEALNSENIDYRIDAGTAIASERFHAHLPWDDDVDLMVMATDFGPDVLYKLEKILAKRGFELKLLTGNDNVRNLTGYQGIYQVAYEENRFKRLIISYVPDISSQDLHNLWIRYLARLSILPHLDIFLVEEVTPGRYTYMAKRFAQGQLRGETWAKDDLFGDRTVNILGTQFKAIQNFKQYSKIAYHTDDIINNFVVSREHSGGCNVLRFKDIRNNKGLLNYMIDYLNFVFNSKAARQMGASFDPEIVRKRFGL